MTLRDKFLAFAIVFVWGVNFVVIKVGLQGMPPLLLAGLRFALVVFPAIFFIKKPQVPWKWMVAYGLTISFGQFSLLFWAIKAGMAAGLASLLLQAQAFITLLLGTLLLKEKIRLHNVIAMIIAALGIYMLAVAQAHDAIAITWFTLALILGASTCWAMGNVINKVITKNFETTTMPLIVWSAIIPTVAFTLASFSIEGTDQIMMSLRNIQWHNIFAILYLSVLATIVGYGGWSYLLSRYEASKVAPLSLLVPVFGLLSAMLLLDEHLNHYQIAGVLVIAAGLAFNVFGHKWLSFGKVVKSLD